MFFSTVKKAGFIVSTLAIAALSSTACVAEDVESAEDKIARALLAAPDTISANRDRHGCRWDHAPRR